MKKLKILFIALFLTLMIDFLQQMPISPLSRHIDDWRSYVAMAEGRAKDVQSYFTRRVLHPWIISKLKLFLSTHTTFLIVAKISLFIFLFVILNILHNYLKLSLPISLASIVLPYIFLIYKDIYVQTLFFICLSSIYFSLLIKKRYLSSFSLLFLLLLTRDEAVIILFSFILAVLLDIHRHPNNRKRYFYVFGAIAVGIVSWMVITKNINSYGNIHRLPMLIFYLLRFPFWAIYNFTGLTLWVDTFKTHLFYTHQPLIIWPAPHWLRSISQIKEIGIYDWSSIAVLEAPMFLLSIFGTGPTILLYFLKKKYFKINTATISFTTILFYGVITFILAPFLSYPLVRYYLNAWPIFFFIMPILLKGIYQREKKIFYRVFGCYFFSAWLLLLPYNLKSFPILLFSIVIEVVLHLYTWHILSQFCKRNASFELGVPF